MSFQDVIEKSRALQKVPPQSTRFRKLLQNCRNLTNDIEGFYLHSPSFFLLCKLNHCNALNSSHFNPNHDNCDDFQVVQVGASGS